MKLKFMTYIHILKAYLSICLYMICEEIMNFKCFTLKVNMEENKIHFKPLMLFYFQKGKKKAVPCISSKKYMRRLWGWCYSWEYCSQVEIFIWKDRERSDKPAVVDVNEIEKMIKINRGYTTGDITELFHTVNMNVVMHLKTFGYVNRYNIWILTN